MVKVDAECIVFFVIIAGVEVGDIEPDLLQKPCEQAVELITKPAAFIDYDLVPNRWFIDLNGTL